MSDETPWGPWKPHPDRPGGWCIGPLDDEIAIVVPPLDDTDPHWMWATFDEADDMHPGWVSDVDEAKAAALRSLEERGVAKPKGGSDGV